MNNAVHGKTMENVENRIDVRLGLVTKKKKIFKIDLKTKKYICQ